MPGLLRRRRALAAKIETTAGTAIAVTATEAIINAFNLEFQYTIEMEQRDGQGGFNRISSVAGPETGTITFRSEISYDGTGVPEWADLYFPACGWVKSGQSFYPKTKAPGTDVKTLTMAVYEDGKIKKISGASGSFTMDFPTGKLAGINWTFVGKAEEEVDGLLIAPAAISVAPAVYKGGFFKHNSVEYCPAMTTIESGNVVSPLECPNTDSGYKYFFIGDRVPMIKTDPLENLVATVDRQAIWTGMTEYPVDMSVPCAGGSFLVAAPKAQIINRQETDRGGLQADSLDFQCNKNGATPDQELSFTFVEAT